MENGKCECIGVATFSIDGETKQFGLTQKDFDLFKEREEKLQERIDETSKHLEHVAEEKAKLENKLAVLSQIDTSFQVKD